MADKHIISVQRAERARELLEDVGLDAFFNEMESSLTEKLLAVPVGRDREIEAFRTAIQINRYYKQFLKTLIENGKVDAKGVERFNKTVGRSAKRRF